MKKAISFALLVMLCFSACTAEQSPKKSTERTTGTPSPKATNTQAPTYTPTPEPAEIIYKEVSIDGGLITMRIPDTLEVYNNTTGSIFTALGMIAGKEDTEHFCSITITRFFQAEEVNMTYEIMDEMVEMALILRYGAQIENKRIGNVQIPENAKGFQSKCIVYDGDSLNYLCLQGAGQYYNIDVSSDSDLIKEETIENIFGSIKIDSEIEARQVNEFKVKLDGNTYYSSRLDGASIEVPENWQPAESSVFTYENMVMGLVSADNLGFINVIKYDKSLYTFESFSEFHSQMLSQIINRGHTLEERRDEIKSLVLDVDAVMVTYPIEKFLSQYLVEYEDALYCAEAYYLGEDDEEIKKIIEAFLSLELPGERLPVE